MQTYNILVLILYSKLMRNIASLVVFNGPPCIFCESPFACTDKTLTKEDQ